MQNLYLLERICGICSHTHALCYSLGVEALAEVTAPPRAQAIRALVAELERMHSHLLWLGVAAHEAGFDTLFMYSWRDRETIMDVLEGLTGNRVNYSANVLGGVKFDVDEKQTDAIQRGLDFLEERTHHYLKVVTTDDTFLPPHARRGHADDRAGGEHRRGRADGARFRHRARCARGCAVCGVRTCSRSTSWSTRRAIWKRASWCASKSCSKATASSARFWINLPPGELTARMPRKVKEGETISRVEAPRGELFYFIKSNGGEKPERVKVRTPSLCNFTSVIVTAPGHQLADMPMILAGIDPCFSCNDRMSDQRNA